MTENDDGVILNGSTDSSDPNDVDEVVVTPPSGGGGWGGGGGTYMPSGEGSGGGGGGGDPQAEQLWQQATAFASNHINMTNLDLNNPDHLKWYYKAHQILTNLFYEFHSRPGTVDGPLNFDLPTDTWLNILEDITIRLTTDEVARGAQYDRDVKEVKVDIDDDRVTAYEGNFSQYGDSAEDMALN